MKNNKGFTLVELLAVIAILGVLVLIAIPSINGVSGLIRNKMLEKKIEMIEESAVLFGEDIRGSIMDSSLDYNNYPCRSIIVSELVPEYLDKDNNNECLISNSVSLEGCIVDPSNSYGYLDKYEVIIYYKNKRIHAKVDLDNSRTCS